MKKIPNLIVFMNSYSYGKNGGDTVFVELAKRLKGYDLTIVTSLLGKKLCTGNRLKASYVITTHESEFSNVLMIYLKRIAGFFKQRIIIKTDSIFLGTSDFLPDVLPIFSLKTKYKNNRWIQHIFHLTPKERFIPFLAQRLSFLMIKRADLLIVDNKLLKHDLVRIGFDARKIAVNYPGINFDFIQSIRTKNEYRYDGIFMAKIRPHKGIFDLIKIWGIVTKKIPKARLGIIGFGDTGTEESLKKMIMSTGLCNNIKLLGFLEDDKALSAVKEGKVFVFPSHEEGFGIAPLEAQALGKPVVAWDLPVFSEIFPKGMIRVKINNMHAFAHEIIKLLTNRKYSEKYTRETIQNAKRFDWNDTAIRENNFIRTLNS